MTRRQRLHDFGESLVEGSFSAFALSHNPLLHTVFFFLAPFAILGAPFFGGMSATGKHRIGLLGAPVAALVIAFINTLPATLTAPLVLHYAYLAYDPIQEATIVNTTLTIWADLAIYSFTMCLLGIGFRNRRYAALRSKRLEAA